MNFRSYLDLVATLTVWQEKLPRDFTVVCGLPRSGLLVANVLALQWNVLLTDPENLLAGRLLGAGRRRGPAPERFLDHRQKVLVVDDSVNGGTTMREARAKLAPAAARHELHFAAAYVTRRGSACVEYAAETVPAPRLFEWNLFHHRLLAEACLDIDGVLCRDPTPEENDDGASYRRFLSTVSPRHLPSVTVGWLVTSRLEKYRPETEDWLHRHGIRYDHLLMLDLPDRQSRLATRAGPAFKAEQYRRTGARLFIESNPRQAQFIAEQGRNYVICTDTMQMFGPSLTSRRVLQARQLVRRRLPGEFMRWRNRLSRVVRRVAGHSPARKTPHGTIV